MINAITAVKSAASKVDNLLGKLGDDLSRPSNLTFPEGLSEERYVNIKIYDTSVGDPNAKLVKIGDFGVDAYKQAFGTVGKTIFESTPFSNLTDNVADAISGAFGDIGSAINDVWGSIKNSDFVSGLGDLWDSAGNFLTGYGDGSNTLGNSPLKGEWKENVWLPLPNNLEESLVHNYTASRGGTAAIPFVGEAQAQLTTYGLESISNVTSKITGRQKIMFNENKVSNYQNTEFRSITLTWTLVANNYRESKAIQEIILALKKYSSPQALSSRLLLRAPYWMKLNFPNKVINDALQFNETVITNIVVNYSPNGNMETFHDDMPKVITLSITFRDREPKVQQNWDGDDSSPYKDGKHAGAGGGSYTGSGNTGSGNGSAAGVSSSVEKSGNASIPPSTMPDPADRPEPPKASNPKPADPNPKVPDPKPQEPSEEAIKKAEEKQTKIDVEGVKEAIKESTDITPDKPKKGSEVLKPEKQPQAEQRKGSNPVQGPYKDAEPTEHTYSQDFIDFCNDKNSVKDKATVDACNKMWGEEKAPSVKPKNSNIITIN